ncbi:MAG: hypothetical protein K5981_02310 [Clostridia bacterium]|nr:hypothetical protein [Clostridia bacterium]
MNDKQKLLQAAFDMALQTTIVKENQTDNADPDIKAAMIDYILFAAVGLNSEQISEFIKDQTDMEDVYLKESFEKAAEDKDAKTVEEIRSHIQDEMEDYFKMKQANIRKRRIEIYVNNQIEEARRKDQEEK